MKSDISAIKISEIDPDTTLVTIDETNLDCYSNSRLKKLLCDLPLRKRTIVDILNAGYIDAIGLGLLIGILHIQRGPNNSLGGSVDIVCTPKIAKVFHITGLNKIFGIYNSVAAAAIQEDRT